MTIGRFRIYFDLLAPWRLRFERAQPGMAWGCVFSWILTVGPLQVLKLAPPWRALK